MTKEELIIFIKNNPENYSIQLKRKHADIFNCINSSSKFETFGQKLYHYINGNDIGHCEICNNICKFDSYNKGYRKRCSYQCMAESKKEKSHEIRNCVICNSQFKIYIKKKKTTCSRACLLKLNKSDAVNKKRINAIKSTLLKKYGVDHASKINGFSEKLKKTKLERYGDENYVNLEKAKQTKLERYGNENYINRDKFKKTCLEKYNVENPSQVNEFTQKANDTKLKKFGDSMISKHQMNILKTNLKDKKLGFGSKIFKEGMKKNMELQ
jgi:hypothetical protein